MTVGAAVAVRLISGPPVTEGAVRVTVAGMEVLQAVIWTYGTLVLVDGLRMYLGME